MSAVENARPEIDDDVSPVADTGPPVKALPPADRLRGQVTRSLQLLLDVVQADDVLHRLDENGVVLDLEVGGYRWVAVQQEDPWPEVVSLSPREAEIARMVAAGLTNRAIATVLDISPWTVGTYLRRIFGKLDVNSRAAMTAAVARLRPVGVPSSPRGRRCDADGRRSVMRRHDV
jgi:DNA-binding CsgD family transcriptional regulator